MTKKLDYRRCPRCKGTGKLPLQPKPSALPSWAKGTQPFPMNFASQTAGSGEAEKEAAQAQNSNAATVPPSAGEGAA